MDFDLPAVLQPTYDPENQVATQLQARNNEYIVPISTSTISSAGGTLTFTIEQSPSLNSLADACLMGELVHSAGTATVSILDVLKSVLSVQVRNNGKLIHDLNDAWAVNEFMSAFRGTEDEDLIAASTSTTNSDGIKGNRALYTITTNDTAVSQTRPFYIPLSRLSGEFWNNSQYLNVGTTQIIIRFSALENSAISGDKDITSLQNLRIGYVNYNLQDVLVESYIDKVRTKESSQKQVYYQVYNTALTNGKGTISVTHNTGSLIKVGVFLCDGSGRERQLIESLSKLDIKVNGKKVSQGAYDNLQDVCFATLEAANMMSQELFGMTSRWYVKSTLSGGAKTDVMLFQVALEDEDSVKSGLSTTNKQLLTVDADLTSPSGTTMYAVCFFEGSLRQDGQTSVFIN